MNHLPKRYVLLMIRKAWLTHPWDLSLRGDDVFHFLLDHRLTQQTQMEQNVKYLTEQAISSNSCQTTQCSTRTLLRTLHCWATAKYFFVGKLSFQKPKSETLKLENSNLQIGVRGWLRVRVWVLSSEHTHLANFCPPNLKHILSTENSYS